MNANAVDIIIIGYRCSPLVAELEARCLASVLTTEHIYALQYLDNYQHQMTLTVAWNRLIKYSPYNYICLLNNDTHIIQPSWLSKMMETLCSDSQIGFVGPSTNSCHSIQNSVPTLEKAESQKMITEVVPDPLSGFCILFRKSLWTELQGFDERYALYGQESDFCDRAHKLGYKSVWRRDAFVYHYGEASVKNSGLDAGKARQEAKDLYWKDRK